MTLTTTFWLICAAMLLLGLLFVVVPLWRGKVTNNDVLRDAANLDILRDQSTEMSADLNNGLLTQEAFEQGQRELQARLLDEVKSPEQVVIAAPRHPAKVLAVVLAVLIPLGSVGLYYKLGHLDALLPPKEQISADASGIIHSEIALQDMEKKLAKTPDSVEGWLQVGRSYAELKRYDDAVRAYEHLAKLAPNESQMWTEYADVYAMSKGQTLKGKPTEFLTKALALDPKNTTALALSGSAAMERGDYVAAITHWQNLLALLPADYPDLGMIKDGVKAAREYLAAQPDGKAQLAKLPALPEAERAVPNTEAAVSGKVSLSPALAAKASPDDIVFILARAATGPKMPLAVLRKQVKDLPLTFSLDDSMAMQSQLKISGFEQVIVVARISKSGSPMATAGDLEGMTAAIKPGTKGLNIVIDQQVK
jgi:cytochrome c-type biogenesis protein CcmH